MAIIPGGCILIARKIQNSGIWEKPAWWLKVYHYILMNVDYKTEGKKIKGMGFFQYKTIFQDCKLCRERGLKPASIDNVIRWLRKTGKLTTNQTTWGIYITTTNYAFYQNINNYRNEEQNEKGTRKERGRNENYISKEGKEGKEVKKDKRRVLLSVPYEDILSHLNSLLKTSYKHQSKKTRSLIDARWKEGYRLEDFKVVHNKKYTQWWNDPDMSQYLRPNTLYGTKFESYLNQPKLKGGEKEESYTSKILREARERKEKEGGTL